jgi:hypothetical protein
VILKLGTSREAGVEYTIDTGALNLKLTTLPE